MAIQNLINKIKEKSVLEEKVKSERIHGRPRLIRPTATEDEIVAGECALGVRLPFLLRECYLQIGNGGFGPNAGAIGFGEYGRHFFIPSATRGDIVHATQRFAKAYPSEWKKSWVAFIHFGGGSVGVVDCEDGKLLAIDIEGDLYPEAPSVEQFFANWVD